MSTEYLMRCRNNRRLTGQICVPKGSDKAMICHPRKKRPQAGGRKKELPPALRQWNNEVMEFKERYSTPDRPISLKQAMQAVKRRRDAIAKRNR